MKISGFIEESMLDYPGRLSAVIFTAGCNYKCPACHARQIIQGESYEENKPSEKEIFDYLDSNKKWIDGVVLCGGEPTKQFGLVNFARKLKEEGLAVKLDTNGSNFAVLGELLEEKLVDYIAMDIKGPPSLYKKIIGLNDEDYFDLRDHVEKGIETTQNAPDYEFRTTVVPIKRENGGLSWMNQQEAREMAEWVHSHTWSKPGKWYIQKFVARTKDEMLDERFCKENLPAEMRETPHKILETIRDAVSKYFPNAKIRE